MKLYPFKDHGTPIPIQARLRRSLLLTALSFFSASFFVAAYLAFKQEHTDESRHQTIVNKTLLELIAPALKISDYAEVERILHLISNEEMIYAVVSNKSDIILSDYTNLSILSSLTPTGSKMAITDCDAIKMNAIHYKGSEWLMTCNDIIPQSSLLKNPHLIGTLLSFHKHQPFSNLLERFFYLILFFVITLIISLSLLQRSVYKAVVSPLEVLASSIRQRASIMGPGSPLKLSNPNISSVEINEIYTSFNELLQIIATHSSRREQEEKEQALNRLSLQVAHDIRSPLAALDSVLKDVSKLQEDKRLIIRSAVGRIRDIANNLIEKNREITIAGQKEETAENTASSTAIESFTGQLLSALIDPLITEKRLQFRSKIGIEIYGKLDMESYGLFANIQPTEFKRVLSNLINNAVEALGEKGTVKVVLSGEPGWIVLRVQDNGKGISPEILAKIGQKGETHGKDGGSGLGLYHARTSVESWGGSLEIRSEVGKGTAVAVKLPQARPPDWFVSKLDVRPNSVIVILDDDTSIHQVWQGRFDSIQGKDHGIEVLHLSTPTELRAWVRDNKTKARNALYLTDYELLGYEETGLTLVEELNLGERAILVTSRYEEKSILEQCLRLKVRLIPKGLAAFVPIALLTVQITVSASPHRTRYPSTVLLDDDALVHMNWKVVAKSKGVAFAAFHNPKEFYAAAEHLPKDTMIYLDSELGDGIHGQDIARELHAKGFINLYLATGHSEADLPPMPWIKQVVGKEPPWN